MAAAIVDTAQQYAAWDFNAETKAQTQALITAHDEAELQKAFGGRLEFGTAGLRGEMGPGSARMNDLTVVQAAQGLAAYLVEAFGEEAKSRGVVLGFDHRARGSLTSRRFALLTAISLLSKGIKVFLFNKLTHTPMVPFTILHRNAIAGVMVTASHNPKRDNGYKVYGGNGAQIISPVDKQIATAIMANLAPWEACRGEYERSFSAGADACEAELKAAHGDKLLDVTEECIAAYFTAVQSQLCRYKKENGAAAGSGGGAAGAGAPVGIAYTAMHGVGAPFAAAAFEAFGLPAFHPTPEQVQPDPEFPTVEFPNPEEGKGALALAMATAEKNGCSLILANDPDADRLAVACKAEAADGTGSTGWRVLTGNEIGALLAHWQFRCFKEAGGDVSNAWMIASTVSSKMLGAMAAKEGFHFQETLTGFKWMGNAMEQRQAEGKTVLFAFEEAIGFCCGSIVRDKDGVSAAAVFAEMAQFYARQGVSVLQQLRKLYDTYGHFITNNYYVFVDKQDKTEAIFTRLRNEGHYWLKMGDLSIKAVRDLTGKGWDSEAADGKPQLPTSSGSHMVTYRFSNGVTMTLRTSGTEPKLKWYSELSGPEPAAVTAELARTVQLMLDEMIRPELHGLKRPALH